MKVLIIDNYDSFTYNLLHHVKELTDDVTVKRNNMIVMEEINNFDAIILSPGPGLPQDAGICNDVIKTYYKTKKILGVCLGHQAIALAFGGKLKNLTTVLHGVSRRTLVCTPPDIIYNDLPLDFLCGRYHSWVVDRLSFPSQLEITAKDEDNEIMSLKHKFYDVRGVQYHPESVMTDYGKKILENWLKS
jgi:anthranilate synthase component 2